MESNKQEYPEFPNSEKALKLYPSLTIISENKELFDSITNSLLRKDLSESYLSEGENYYATLGWSIGFLSKIIAIMIKNGWKKQ